MSNIIGSGVIEVSADSRKLTAGIDAAKKSLKGLGIAASDATKGQSQSIDRYVKSLGMAAVTAGKTGRELELYKLALRGANAEQLKAADSALRMSESYARSEKIGQQIRRGFLTLGAAAATGLIASFVAFDQLTKKAGDFQDMAEKTGDTAQNIASLAVAAGTAGASMETVVSASTKLTKGLSGVDDESKAAGAAIAALGLNIKDFKALAPADQMEAVAKALGNFQDGAEKTAVAMALFGKTGADLLPFLKELGAEGGRQVILTAEQIKQADEYADKQARLRTELNLHAQVIATHMLKAYNAFSEALIDVSKELLGVKNGVSTLTQDNSISEFAASAARALATVADAAYMIGQGFNFAGNNIGAAAAQAVAIAKLDFAGAGVIGRASNDFNDKISFSLGLADRVEKRLANVAGAYDPSNYSNEGRSSSAPAKKKISFNGVVKTPKGSKSNASNELKEQLGLDIENIRSASAKMVSTYANAEKIMEARRAAGLIDESDYYKSKLGFLSLNRAAQEAALQDEIARLQKEKLVGSDRIANEKKINDARAKLDAVRAGSETAVEVLGIQQASALKSIAKGYRDAEDAAQDYLDTIRKSQQIDLSGMGIGNRERSRMDGRAQIEDKYTSQRNDLEKSRRDSEFSGTYGPEAQAKYADELDRIKRFSSAALLEYDAYFNKRTQMEADWSIGANEAMANYLSESQEIAAQTEAVFSNAFQGMEDALVTFITTGKLSFTDMANSIVADITRIIVKQQIANALGSIGIGKTGGGGVGAIGSFAFDNFDPFNLISFDGGGYTGSNSRSGGLDGKGGFVAMLHPQEDVIDHTKGQSTGNTVNVTVNQTFAAGTSRATTLQAAADARRQLEYAGRNL
jgi:lambda family phage tail tape measure protein